MRAIISARCFTYTQRVLVFQYHLRVIGDRVMHSTLMCSVCNRMKTTTLIGLVLVLSIMSLVSCKNPLETGRAVSPLTPPIVVPIPSMAAVTGQVVSASTSRPMANTTVRLARVFWNEQHTDGVYVLEGARSPSAITNDGGFFVFANLNPADYVLVVGDVFGDHVIVSNPDGSAKIFTAEENKVTDAGQIFVDLPVGNH